MAGLWAGPWAALKAESAGQRAAMIVAACVGALAGLMATAQLGAAWGAHLIDGGVAPAPQLVAQGMASEHDAAPVAVAFAETRFVATSRTTPVAITPERWRAAALGPWGARVCLGPIRIDVPRAAPVRVRVTEDGCEGGVITLTRLPAPVSWDGVDPDQAI